MVGTVNEIPVALPHPALPAADWADAYRVVAGRRFASARAAGEAAFADFPVWVRALMALRNIIVAPLGLKTGDKHPSKTARIGFFPLVSEEPCQVVVGMNDRHLDFRCVIDLAEKGDRQEITIATVIDRHNRLGRIYLAAILPFHRLILHVVLTRLGKDGG
jgi:hypothetical protein